MSNLIFGKDNTKNIVSLEIKDEMMELFIQQEDGSIVVESRPNKYWILSHNPLKANSRRLEGNLYYRYMITTSDREVFTKGRYQWKNKDIFSIYNQKEAAMVKDGITYYKGLKHNEVSVLSFDIETTGLVYDDSSAVLLISNTFRDSKGNITRKLFAYDEYESQADMLVSWTNWVKEKDPSILCGHNEFIFDLQYLQYIADQNEITLDLGRDGSPIEFNKYVSHYRIDGSRTLDYKSAHIYGREIVDTLFLAYKYGVTKNYESYGLKKLIAVEGLEAKDREFYDASQIRFNYKIATEWEKIKRYCIHDSDDSLALWDLMGPPLFYTGQYIPKSFQTITESASGSQINSIMMRSYLQEGHSLPHASPVDNFQGGISFGIPGIYKNCWKIDIRSSYPSAILINKLYSKEKDPKANMYNLCKYFTLQRIELKKKVKETNDPRDKGLDASAKIFINSMFGFCSAPGLLFNDPRVAAEITRYGREFLNNGSKWATGKDLTYWMKDDIMVEDDESAQL